MYYSYKMDQFLLIATCENSSNTIQKVDQLFSWFFVFFPYKMNHSCWSQLVWLLARVRYLHQVKSSAFSFALDRFRHFFFIFEAFKTFFVFFCILWAIVLTTHSVDMFFKNVFNVNNLFLVNFVSKQCHFLVFFDNCF